MKTVVKKGAGILKKVSNSIIQPYKSIKVYVDGQQVFYSPLNVEFEKTWPYEDGHDTLSTDSEGQVTRGNKFYSELAIETTGEVSIVYR